MPLPVSSYRLPGRRVWFERSTGLASPRKAWSRCVPLRGNMILGFKEVMLSLVRDLIRRCARGWLVLVVVSSSPVSIPVCDGKDI